MFKGINCHDDALVWVQVCLDDGACAVVVVVRVRRLSLVVGFVSVGVFFILAVVGEDVAAQIARVREPGITDGTGVLVTVLRHTCDFLRNFNA